MATLDDYGEIWLLDCEFQQPEGERPKPLCLVAREYRCGEMIRLWRDDLVSQSRAPFGVGPDSLLVAYYSSAELGCFLALGWPLPANVLDLYPEFRRLTCGLTAPHGHGLFGALAHHGLDCLAAVEKEELRELAMRGGPYSEHEQVALLDYCQSDVDALAQLLPAMLPQIDLPRALLRGRYMAAVARMERTGIPIVIDTLARLRSGWGEIQDRLIADVDRDYRVYEGRSFRAARFRNWLARAGIRWPRRDSGKLALDDDTFKDMARSYPQVAPLRELRRTLSAMRSESLTVGADGRNRCLLSPFASVTSRNQPSSKRFVFGQPAWLRGLIRPAPGRALAYVDWGQQEFGIAAALSQDPAMMEAYSSGDPYLTFARQAGAVSAGANRRSHAQVREQYKVASLAVQYGMGEQTLAQRLGVTRFEARQLLSAHRRTYPRYWRWNDAAVDFARLHRRLHTVFGWQIQVTSETSRRTLANFPMQSNGAEMLRIACILLTEAGIEVCAPVHDAVLVEAPIDEIEEVAQEAQRLMRQASEIVLDGFPLRTSVAITRYPDRYSDPRGVTMRERVQRPLAEEVPVAPAQPLP